MRRLPVTISRLLLNAIRVRETGALQAIATEMGFRSRRDYEAAVLKLLEVDEKARAWVISLFSAAAFGQ